MDLYINIRHMDKRDVVAIINGSNTSARVVSDTQIHVKSNHHLWLVRLLTKLTGRDAQFFHSPTVIVV